MSAHSCANQQVHQLFLDHQYWLVNWLTNKLHCSDRAEDVCQETFIRLLGKSSQDILHKPRAFLTKIAHGLLVDEVRRRDIETSYLRSLQQLPTEHSPDPEQQQIVLETLYQVDALLDGLKPKVRIAFLLFRLEGKKQQEIATELDVSLSSVEKYLRQALLHCYQAQYG